MNKKLIVTILAGFVLNATFIFSQTLTLKPYGVSPRDVAADTTDIFDRAYNGLVNVGVETKMFLKGTFEDSSLSNPVWAITQQPVGSAATIDSPINISDSIQVVAFTPDIVGTYKIEFTDGNYSASITINAGTYLGIEDGGCAQCHKEKADEWKATGHSSMLERGLEGTLSDHYASYCIGCHTTGYDVNADNNGFDDFTFVFPDSLFPGMYDSMMTKYPDAMKRANIQCESCHGPGSAHFSVTSDSKMVSSLNADDCAWCHDSGTHHVYPEQWDVSKHANQEHPYTRSSCAPCHNGAGFIKFVEGGKVGLTEDMPKNVPITCATCHDPHSNDNEHQLRTLEVKLGNGLEVNGGGFGKLCMNCHKSRRNAADYTGPDFHYSSHYGPHHGPQADMLIGTNVPTFGKRLPSSAHFAATENACVTCHMAEGHVDEQGNVIKVGSHSFNMVSPEGKDNVVVCEECHGDIGESFSEKKFYFNGEADHDGDGVEEGLQEEVEGLMETLALMLPPLDSNKVDVSGKYIYTETDAKAAYNYLFVQEDRSLGVHNPAFTVSLLKVSIQAVKNHTVMGGIVAIDDVPNDQGKQVRIIWNKFADDGIAVDPIASYTIKRFDGDSTVWTGVGEHTADGSPRYALVVPTLYDSTAEGNALTSFKIVAISRSGMAYESAPAQGYSVDNLVPHAPTDLVALQSDKNVELTWEAPDDPDINFYRIYRSTEETFVADETTEIGTTIELSFTDMDLGVGTYYYKVAAVDFSGNLGKLSATVNATITSVSGNDNDLPTEFSLSQNYPNPFNPITTIDFSLLKAGHVTLTVYNMLGQKVTVLVDKNMSVGNHAISYNGVGLSSGEYFYRIEVSDNDGILFQTMRKMILMK